MSCTIEEELDLQGLIDYIRGDMLEEFEKALYANRPDEMGRTRQVILGKAEDYACAKNNLSAKRARQIASQAMKIIKTAIHDGFSLDLKLVSSEDSAQYHQNARTPNLCLKGRD